MSSPCLKHCGAKNLTVSLVMRSILSNILFLQEVARSHCIVDQQGFATDAKRNATTCRKQPGFNIEAHPELMRCQADD